MNWYAIKTQNNRERTVLERLKLESSRNGLDIKIGKCIIPTERVVSAKDGKRIAREKIIYPGYIFIETNSVGEISNLLKSVSGFSGFVKTKSGEINPIKESEIKKMFLDDDHKNNEENITIDFAIGEDVKVIGGPFDTFKGTITEIDKIKKKIKLAISIFNRKTMVDVEYNQIQRII